MHPSDRAMYDRRRAFLNDQFEEARLRVPKYAKCAISFQAVASELKGTAAAPYDDLSPAEVANTQAGSSPAARTSPVVQASPMHPEFDTYTSPAYR